MTNTRNLALGLLLLEPHGKIDWAFGDGGVYFIMDEDNELNEHEANTLTNMDWNLFPKGVDGATEDVWAFTE